jgi:hypothetical protein
MQEFRGNGYKLLRFHAPPFPTGKIIRSAKESQTRNWLPVTTHHLECVDLFLYLLGK